MPLYVDGPLPVGAERRYGLAVGCGGGVWIDGQTWELTGPLPEPLRNAWPHVAPVSTDGPQVEIFGRITRTAAGTIAFSIEGLGTVAMLRPITTAPALHGA